MGTYILVSLVLAAIMALIVGIAMWLEERTFSKSSIILLAVMGVAWGGIVFVFNWLATPTIDLTRSMIYWELFFTLLFAGTISLKLEQPVMSLLWVICGLGMLVTECSSGRMMQADKHQSLLDMTNDDIDMIISGDSVISEKMQDSLFNQTISPVSLEKMRVVSSSVASVLAEQLMGQITALGSQYEIGEMSLQSITGKFTITDGLGHKYNLDFDHDFIYVAPLEFRGFFKWRQTGKISKAYVIVSATNENVYHLVTEVNGKPIEMRYLNSAFFSHELRRHMRWSGYMGEIEDTGIQIDAEGRPYNVFAKIENQIGWGGDKVVGSLVVDMQTGEIKEYSLEDTPDFIDVVQPTGLLRSNVEKHYSLIHGFWNFSEKDVLKASKNLQVVYGDNRCCYYTGLTSTGADHSTSGFILSDAKTGITTFYKMSGILEDRAEGAILAHEWTAKYRNYEVGNAVLYNVGGLQTYYAPIISGNKIVGHGFCSLKNVNVVGAGRTKEEAYAAYMRSYYLSFAQQSLSDEGSDVAGQVLTIKKMRQEGSRYNFLFEEYEGKSFYVFSEMVPEVRWIDETAKKVRVDFRMTDDKEVPIKDISLVE